MKNTKLTIRVTGVQAVDKAIKELEDARTAMANAVINARTVLTAYGVNVECDVELDTKPADSSN